MTTGLVLGLVLASSAGAGAIKEPGLSRDPWLDPMSSGRRLAFLVGVSEPSLPQFRPTGPGSARALDSLDMGPALDVKALELAARKFGWTPSPLTTPENSSSEAILRRLSSLRLGPEDSVWFHYSGHAMGSGEDLLMATTGVWAVKDPSGVSSLSGKPLWLSEVIKTLRRTGASRILVTADACRKFLEQHGGQASSTESLAGLTSRTGVQEGEVWAPLPSPGLERPPSDVPFRLDLLFSCGPGELSYQRPKRMGVFTDTLVQGLEEAYEASHGAGLTIEQLMPGLRARVRQQVALERATLAEPSKLKDMNPRGYALGVDAVPIYEEPVGAMLVEMGLPARGAPSPMEFLRGLHALYGEAFEIKRLFEASAGLKVPPRLRDAYQALRPRDRLIVDRLATCGLDLGALGARDSLEDGDPITRGQGILLAVQVASLLQMNEGGGPGLLPEDVPPGSPLEEALRKLPSLKGFQAFEQVVRGLAEEAPPRVMLAAQEVVRAREALGVDGFQGPIAYPDGRIRPTRPLQRSEAVGLLLGIRAQDYQDFRAMADVALDAMAGWNRTFRTSTEEDVQAAMDRIPASFPLRHLKRAIAERWEAIQSEAKPREAESGLGPASGDLRPPSRAATPGVQGQDLSGLPSDVQGAFALPPGPPGSGGSRTEIKLVTPFAKALIPREALAGRPPHSLLLLVMDRPGKFTLTHTPVGQEMKRLPLVMDWAAKPEVQQWASQAGSWKAMVGLTLAVELNGEAEELRPVKVIQYGTTSAVLIGFWSEKQKKWAVITATFEPAP